MYNRSLNSLKKDIKTINDDENLTKEFNLLFKIARKLKVKFPIIEIEDLISEGYLGLAKAKEKFNPKFKCPFLCYASYWVFNKMENFISNSLFHRNINFKLEKIKGLPLGYQEIADKLGVKYTTVIDYLRTEVPFNDEFSSLSEKVKIEQVILIEKYKALIKQLSITEQWTLCNYYGLEGIIEVEPDISGCRSFAKLAREAGESRENMRLRHNKAISKLKHLI